jgi:hypothetical protein
MKESSKEGTFSKEGGHKSQEKIYVSIGPKYFSVVGGRTIRIRTVCTTIQIWHRKRGRLGHDFRAEF